MNSKIVKKKNVFYQITRFLCVKSKNTHEQKWLKISTIMCMPSLGNINETCRSRVPHNPPWVPPPPENRQTSIFHFIAYIHQWR